MKNEIKATAGNAIFIRAKADTLDFYKQTAQALAHKKGLVLIGVSTPTKEIQFTASINSAHALITCIASTWSGAELTIAIR